VHRPAGQRKELHYFDSMPLEWPSAEMVGNYHAYFPRPEDKLVGEWTPRYLYDFWVPPLLAEAAPSARLLVLLRDPVERFRSGLTLSLRNNAGISTKALINEAFARGLYWEQLKRVFQWFDPDQVLILQYERCVRHPRGELARTFDFLGLDTSYRPSDPTAVVNGTRGEKVSVSPQLCSWLVEAYRDDVGRLTEHVSTIDPSMWLRS
jgi:hypothetical protein